MPAARAQIDERAVAIERRGAREHLDARLGVAHARVGGGQERAQLGVLDAPVAVDVGGAGQRRAQLVREDAAAVARPLVRLLIARGGDDDAGARVALELLLLEERAAPGRRRRRPRPRRRGRRPTASCRRAR